MKHLRDLLKYLYILLHPKNQKFENGILIFSQSVLVPVNVHEIEILSVDGVN